MTATSTREARDPRRDNGYVDLTYGDLDRLASLASGRNASGPEADTSEEVSMESPSSSPEDVHTEEYTGTEIEASPTKDKGIPSEYFVARAALAALPGDPLKRKISKEPINPRTGRPYSASFVDSITNGR